jgi:hypothetical protein
MERHCERRNILQKHEDSGGRSFPASKAVHREEIGGVNAAPLLAPIPAVRGETMHAMHYNCITLMRISIPLITFCPSRYAYHSIPVIACHLPLLSPGVRPVEQIGVQGLQRHVAG